MERYHIFKMGLAVIFYAVYCIRPMMVIGIELDDVNGTLNTNNEYNLAEDDYYVYYQGVEGTPGIDFPIFSHIPRTGFDCQEMESNGYYADLETDCQVFHICEEGKKVSFLCPNGTVFQQADLICEWWFKVNCTDAPNLYQESVEVLRDNQVRSKASRRVSGAINSNTHGAVMRLEEQSSVSATRNGKKYDIQSNRISDVPSKARPSKSLTNNLGNYGVSQQRIQDGATNGRYQQRDNIRNTGGITVSTLQNKDSSFVGSGNQGTRQGDNNFIGRRRNFDIKSAGVTASFVSDNRNFAQSSTKLPKDNYRDQSNSNAPKRSNSGNSRRNLPTGTTQTEDTRGQTFGLSRGSTSYTVPPANSRKQAGTTQTEGTRGPSFDLSTRGFAYTVPPNSVENARTTRIQRTSTTRAYRGDMKATTARSTIGFTGATQTENGNIRLHLQAGFGQNNGLQTTRTEPEFKTSSRGYQNEDKVFISGGVTKSLLKGNSTTVNGGFKNHFDDKVNIRAGFTNARPGINSQDSYVKTDRKQDTKDSSAPASQKNFVKNAVNNIPLNRKDIVEKKIEPNDSDETQITQESSSFVKNSANRIRDDYKRTTNPYPNHRETYSDIKDPKSFKEKYGSSISSVTPQYITTQPINNGKPFVGSRVGISIKPKSFATSYSSSTAGSFGTTPPDVYLSSATEKNAFGYTESRDHINSITPSSVDNFDAGVANRQHSRVTHQSYSSYSTPAPFNINSATPSTAFNYGTGVTKYSSDVTNIQSSVVTQGPQQSYSTFSTPTPYHTYQQSTFNDAGTQNKEYPSSSDTPKPEFKYVERFTLTTPLIVEKFNIGYNQTLPTVAPTTPTTVPTPITNKFNQGTPDESFKLTNPTSTPIPRRGNAVIPTVGSFNIHKTGEVGSKFDKTASKFPTANGELANRIVQEISRTTGTPITPAVPTSSRGLFNVRKTGTPVPISIPTGLPLLRRGSAVVPTVGSFNVGSSTRSGSSSIAGHSLSHSFNTFSSPTNRFEDKPNQFSRPKPFSVNTFNNGFVTKQTTAAPFNFSSKTTVSPMKKFNNLYAHGFAKDTLPPSVSTNNIIQVSTPSSAEKFSSGQVEVSSTQAKTYFGVTTPASSHYTPQSIQSSDKARNTYSDCGSSHVNTVPSSTVVPTQSSADNLSENTVSIPPIGSLNDGKSTVKVGFQTIQPLIEISTKRAIDHATVWGTFTKTHTTPSSHVSGYKDDKQYSGNVASTSRFSTKPSGGTTTAGIRSTTERSFKISSPNSIVSSTPKVYVKEGLTNEESRRPFNQNGFFVTRNPFQVTTRSPIIEQTTTESSHIYEKTPIRPSISDAVKPRPFQLLTAVPRDQSLFTTTPRIPSDAYTKPPYKVSSAAPFTISTKPSVSEIQTVPDQISNSIYENVDNMIYALMNMTRENGEDHSSETPRPGLVVPPSAGPQTLHTLAVYFANALDGMGAEKDKDGHIKMTDEEKERFTVLLTRMTMDRYNELFGDKESNETTEDTTSTEDTQKTDLEGQHSKNPVQTNQVRQLAKVFTNALSDYLDDPDSFKKTLEGVRPTEPPPLPEVEDTTSPDDELLNFSDADSKSSFPPVYPTPPSVGPTWGYILAPTNRSSDPELDVKNSLNPDENLHQSDSQSFVSQFNSLTSTDKEKVTKSEKTSVTISGLPTNHWTSSPDVTKLWRTTLSVNPIDINHNFKTTEATITTVEEETTEEILPDKSLGTLEPQEEVKYELHRLPQLSLNSTQVHGILIDFMNNSKTEEGKLQRILRKLNTTQDEFLSKMKEIEGNPLTRRLILLLISECGQNVTKEIESRAAPSSFQVANTKSPYEEGNKEKLIVAQSSYVGGQIKSSNSALVDLVDPSLGDNDEDARALQLLNSLYTIASKFGK